MTRPVDMVLSIIRYLYAKGGGCSFFPCKTLSYNYTFPLRYPIGALYMCGCHAAAATNTEPISDSGCVVGVYTYRECMYECMCGPICL